MGITVSAVSEGLVEAGASEAKAKAPADVDCTQTENGPRKRKRKTRPTRMTWCEDCGRAGLRWKEADPLEEHFKRSSMTLFR